MRAYLHEGAKTPFRNYRSVQAGAGQHRPFISVSISFTSLFSFFTHSKCRLKKNNRHALQKMTRLARDFLGAIKAYQPRFRIASVGSLCRSNNVQLIQAVCFKTEKLSRSSFAFRLYDYSLGEVISSETSGIREENERQYSCTKIP